jgi:hypothetical protein
MYGFTLPYVAGPLIVAAGVQQNSDNRNHKQTIFNANAVSAFSATKLYVGYLHSKDRTGLVDSVLAQQSLVPGVDIVKGSGRIDNGPFAGVTWQATRALTLTGAAYYDHIAIAAMGDGRWLSLHVRRDGRICTVEAHRCVWHRGFRQGVGRGIGRTAGPQQSGRRCARSADDALHRHRKAETQSPRELRFALCFASRRLHAAAS